MGQAWERNCALTTQTQVSSPHHIACNINGIVIASANKLQLLTMFAKGHYSQAFCQAHKHSEDLVNGRWYSIRIPFSQATNLTVTPNSFWDNKINNIQIKNKKKDIQMKKKVKHQ